MNGLRVGEIPPVMCSSKHNRTAAILRKSNLLMTCPAHTRITVHLLQ